MHTKNTDIEDGLVNGVTGVITHIDINKEKPKSGTIYVQFDSVNVGKSAKRHSSIKGSVSIKAVTESFALPLEGKISIRGTKAVSRYPRLGHYSPQITGQYIHINGRRYIIEFLALPRANVQYV